MSYLGRLAEYHRAQALLDAAWDTSIPQLPQQRVEPRVSPADILAASYTDNLRHTPLRPETFARQSRAPVRPWQDGSSLPQTKRLPGAPEAPVASWTRSENALASAVDAAEALYRRTRQPPTTRLIATAQKPVPAREEATRTFVISQFAQHEVTRTMVRK